MSWQDSHEPCQMNCRWNGTPMCVRCLLTIECVEQHHIGLAVTCGLKKVYEPHGLPPCVKPDGKLNWDTSDLIGSELLPAT